MQRRGVLLEGFTTLFNCFWKTVSISSFRGMKSHYFIQKTLAWALCWNYDCFFFHLNCESLCLFHPHVSNVYRTYPSDLFTSFVLSNNKERTQCVSYLDTCSCIHLLWYLFTFIYYLFLLKTFSIDFSTSRLRCTSNINTEVHYIRLLSVWYVTIRTLHRCASVRL